jgi:ribonuclease E
VCAGRGIIVHHDPVTKHRQSAQPEPKRRGKGGQQSAPKSGNGGTHAITEDVKNALAQIAASTIAATAIAPVVELADQEIPTVEAAASEAADAIAASVDAAVQQVVEAETETVAILDIPVVKGSRASRRISTKDAEELLDSVLDALPESPAPGTKRARTSRRATSAGLAAEAASGTASGTVD